MNNTQNLFCNSIKTQSSDWQDETYQSTFWHTSAHLLAYALEELYPGIKLGTGPAIENGFYYDVDFGEYSFTDKDFRSRAKNARIGKKRL